MKGYKIYKKISLIKYLLICSTFSAFTQVDSSKTKLDSIQTNYIEPLELPTSSPLTNKTIGIGLNPLRLFSLIGQNGEDFARLFRATVSVFAIDRHAELAFPIQYMWGKNNSVPWRDFYFDVTYRRFFGSQQKGPYYSGGIRYAYIEGEELCTDKATYGEGLGNIIVQNKVGIYAGIGYLHCSRIGFYWGGNIILGIYFGPKTPYIATMDDVTLNSILGCYLFEIGFAF
jgi:hypothetical protein